MRIVAGAIVILAGSVFFAGGVLASAVLTAANRAGYSVSWGWSMAVGGVLVLFGMGVMARGVDDMSRAQHRPPS